MSSRLGNKIAIKGVIKSWTDINWRSVTRNVKKLRMRIFRATQKRQIPISKKPNEIDDEEYLKCTACYQKSDTTQSR